LVRGTKKTRGRAQASLILIDHMYEAAMMAQPITVRGVAYKLFVRNLIPSMDTNDVRRVSRLLLAAREEDTIPWEWIVDETRELERASTWDSPEQYANAVARSYRLDNWNQQPHRVEVWSEKGTIRGVLQPVLDQYAVGFRVMHGFGSATAVHEVAEHFDGRPLIILYVGDYDPSGMYMSECDLPTRFEKYAGHHVDLRRIALKKPKHTRHLPWFPAADKKDDPRYAWFVANCGDQCWELDAMDPNALRDLVKREIKKLIEPVAWARCQVANDATRASMQEVMETWKALLREGR
jgi:hypothetical protein